MERHSGLSSKFIWIFIAAVLGILLVAGIQFAASDADDRNTYGAVNDFNIAMRSCFLDQMSRYWDTSFEPDEADMPTEDIAQGTWHIWEDYSESAEPYLGNDDLNDKLSDNAYAMSYSESERKKLSNGMYFVSGTYHYNTMAQSKCTEECANALASHQGYSLETCSGIDMEDILKLWYQDVKDVDLYSDNDVTAKDLKVSYLIRKGYIVAFRYDDADADESSLACVMLADLPHIYNDAQKSASVILADNKKQAEIDAAARKQAKAEDDAQKQAQDEAEAAAREQARKEAADREQARQKAEAAAQEQARPEAAAERQTKANKQATQQAPAQKQQQNTTPSIRGAYAPDPSYVPQQSSNNTTHASNNPQDYSEPEDPDDHDIEDYYDDYRDEFEDEDDAYDGYMDDEEWEDDY